MLVEFPPIFVAETQLQWNFTKADTYGREDFVRFREVSALDKFELKSFQI